MRRIRAGVFIAGVVAVLFSTPSGAMTVIWRNTPIAVDLIVGVEQLLMLPGNGAVGLPPALASDRVFKTLSNNGTVYFTALEAFDAERVQVRLDNGEYILLDVSARVEKAPPTSMEPLQIAFDQPATGSGAVLATGPMSTTASSAPEGPATLFELIRYAAQELYSPKRLVSAVNGIRPVPVGIRGNFTAIYDQGKHRGLIIQPHRAWSAGGLYVTAFIVTNKHTHSVVLDNRRVRHAQDAERSGVAPHFVASAFFDREVTPRDSDGDRTTLFIVTEEPIRRVLGRLSLSRQGNAPAAGGVHGQ